MQADTNKQFSTLLLNLPNSSVITRRYMCSYNSPMSLFPPYELISLGGIVRSWKNAPVRLIDAIADRLTFEKVRTNIEANRPDLIVTIIGFECFAEDMQQVNAFKSAFPDIPLVLMGHYPTIFAETVLRNCKADYILLGEPDINFSELYDALSKGTPVSTVGGIAYRDNGEVLITGKPKRIAAIDELPMPAFELLPRGKYGEPAMPRPFGMIQTARGCPYSCNYCVKSYGQRLSVKSPVKVLEEVQFLMAKHGIKSLRFIDDTFTINHSRVIEICKLFIERGIDIEWTCLSRTDNLNEELLSWMKKAGCRRIYFGLESGSQRVLDLYDKRVNKQEALEALLLCRKHGIETSGFFMLGLPFETYEDFKETLIFARQAKLTHAGIGPLTLYPGTELYEKYKHTVNFSLFPYRNEFTDKALEERWARWEREFYRSFFFQPAYLFTNFKAIVKNPVAMAKLGKDMFLYMLNKGNNAFNNLRPQRYPEAAESPGV